MKILLYYYLLDKNIKFIGIDSTYNVSREGYSLCIFITVNKFWDTRILAFYFMASEKKIDYDFGLQTFQSLFSIPENVITDQEKALISSINDNWPKAHHIFCIFHIFRNIQQNLGIKLNFF